MCHPPSMEQRLAAALAEHLPFDASEVARLLEKPPSPEVGDCALPCFALARELRKNPARIAADLAASIELPDGFRDVRAEGPYLNFFINRRQWTEYVLKLVHRLGPAFGNSDAGAGCNVVIDFGSPNIAKHLGVHHLPGTLIGMALCRVYSALGYNVVGINYLGDWGTSFGRLIAAVERYGVTNYEGLDVSGWMDLYVRYSTEAEGDEGLQQAARDAFRRLEQGDPDAARIWRAVRNESLAEFERAYQTLGVEYDRVTGESEYVQAAAETVGWLLREGIAVESDGAVVVPLDDEEMPPCMVRKSDGTTIYAARDICAALERWREFEFEKALYVVGNEQALHFGQLRAVLRKMGCEWAERIEHVNFGLIKFRDPETGEARVGSTRRGEMLYMQQVLDEATCRARQKIEQNLDRFEEGTDLDAMAAEVGIGAVVFGELSTRRTRSVVFDWDRILDFEGDTGPYVQYAHARLCSILRKAQQAVRDCVDYERLALPEEWVLVRHIETFPRAVERAAAENEPSVIANYLLALCADFSSYYSAGMREPERRVLCPDEATRAARLVLVNATRHVIRNGLQLLGIAAPERM